MIAVLQLCCGGGAMGEEFGVYIKIWLGANANNIVQSWGPWGRFDEGFGVGGCKYHPEQNLGNPQIKTHILGRNQELCTLAVIDVILLPLLLNFSKI